MFREGDGKISYSRVSGSVVIVVQLLLACVVVLKDGIIPDIPLGWAALVGALYGMNKYSK